MTTRQPITSPSHDTLLADLFELNFRIEDLIAKHSLTPAQFLAFAKDPLVVETLDTFESLQQRHQRIAARQHQAGAAGHLHQSILDAPSTIETRRAATALARLTTQMLAVKSPSRKSPDEPAIGPTSEHTADSDPTSNNPTSKARPAAPSSRIAAPSDPITFTPATPSPPATLEPKPARRKPPAQRNLADSA